MLRSLKFIFLFVIITLVAACAPGEPLQLHTPVVPVYQTTLSPYATRTPEPSTTPDISTPTMVPTATATPRLHTVALSETLLTIAWRYGVTLEALQNANPEIDPNILIVGQQLVIPAAAPEEVVENPTPTPLALTLTQPNCIPDANGGLWCLLSATHPERGSENIAAEMRLYGAGSVESLNKLAAAPLNHSVAGETLPLAVYFTPQELTDAPFEPPYQAQAVLVQALPLNNMEGRYLPILVSHQETTLSPDGLSVEISGELTLNELSPAPAERIWLVAALYGDAGQLLGFRRWESTVPLNPGDRIAFTLHVYSLDESPIETIVFLTEAVPSLD